MMRGVTMIYFDQAASSFPKPAEVGDAMVHALNNIGANPGRGSHLLAREAATVIQETRETAARIFGCSNPRKAVFFQNATIALNQAIKGLSWERGDHVIATSFEHNSIRRPLEYLKRTQGVTVTYMEWKEDAQTLLKEMEDAVNSKTKLIAITHASNVTGSLIPIDGITRLAKENNLRMLVDASQTAGHIPINMMDQNIDMLVFPGHKGLLGPQGTGMLLVEGDINLQPIHHGGTGSFSETAEQPTHWPEVLESGTLNTPGIAGLNAALSVFETRKTENVPRETILARELLKGISQINGVTCYGPSEQNLQIPIVAFNIRNVASQEIAIVLDSHYEIAIRAGLHCSPLAHESLKTIEQGVVRASLSIYNTREEVNAFLEAIEEIASAYSVLP